MSCPPQVESLALTFLSHKQLRSAAWFFARCLASQPSNANVWYGIANALTTLGFRHAVPGWTETGIACHKRANLEAGGSHHLADEFLTELSEKSSRGKELVDKVEAWNKSVELLLEAIPFSEEALINEYREIEVANDKLAILMFGGETRFIELIPLYKFVLFSQEEKDPKLVVMDTIHLFRDHPDLPEIYAKIVEKGIQDELEPYFSLSLDRIDRAWTGRIPRNKK